MKYTPPTPSIGHGFHVYQRMPGIWIAVLTHDGNIIQDIEGGFPDGPLDVLNRLITRLRLIEDATAEE